MSWYSVNAEIYDFIDVVWDRHIYLRLEERNRIIHASICLLSKRIPTDVVCNVNKYLTQKELTNEDKERFYMSTLVLLIGPAPYSTDYVKMFQKFIEREEGRRARSWNRWHLCKHFKTRYTL